jgi:hypothetical protein
MPEEGGCPPDEDADAAREGRTDCALETERCPVLR